MPRPRPPFPAVRGLFGKPTIINNVETLANIPKLMEIGPDAFQRGRDRIEQRDQGLRTLGKDHLHRTGRGRDGHQPSAKSCSTSAAGSPTARRTRRSRSAARPAVAFREQHLDIKIDYESLKTVGAMMGSGGLVVMDEDTCMVDLAKFFMDFIQRESCGKCIPCREGTRRMLEILDVLTRGRKHESRLDASDRFMSVTQLQQLAETIRQTSLCGLGQTAANPVLSTLRWFRDEYEAHLFQRKCPAGACAELVTYRIDPQLCKGCTACLKKCPTEAIFGSRKNPHYIDPEKCIGCGACLDVCKLRRGRQRIVSERSQRSRQGKSQTVSDTNYISHRKRHEVQDGPHRSQQSHTRGPTGRDTALLHQRHGFRSPRSATWKGFRPAVPAACVWSRWKGMPNLVPSCAFPVRDGMQVLTHSPRVVEARKTIVELLLADHPDDCLFCARSGNCRLQDLASELGVKRRFRGAHSQCQIDMSSPSIVRDPAKCILCGKCVRVCEEVQQVGAIDFIGRGSRASVGTAFDEGLNVSSCINCGQCVVVCPTGALTEKDYTREVVEALDDPDTFVVVQHAPSISVSLGEEFGLPPGVDVAGNMTAALRVMGFDRVFDTGFSADLTIMEEGSELVHRIQNGGTLPMLTSCSPGWIRYVETFHPDFMDNLSTCKSPQQMMGAVIKSYFAEREGIDPARIFSVSVMPCTAKKFEAARPEMARHGVADVDAVLTTRELARLIRSRGIDLRQLQPEAADTPFGERTTAGKIFGASGGVMEAAIRTAHHLLTGEELADLNVEAVRGFDGLKQAQLEYQWYPVGCGSRQRCGQRQSAAERDPQTAATTCTSSR